MKRTAGCLIFTLGGLFTSPSPVYSQNPTTTETKSKPGSETQVEITQIITSWIRNNKWSWNEGTKSPDSFSSGNLTDTTEEYVAALVSVEDGGINVTQYIHLFKNSNGFIVPITNVKVGQKGSALIDSLTIKDRLLYAFGKTYNYESNAPDPSCCPSIASKWIYKLEGNSLNLTNGPALPWFLASSTKRTTNKLPTKTVSARPFKSVLTDSERRIAEKPFAKDIARAEKHNPENAALIRTHAALKFVCERALIKVGYRPGGIDYFNRIIENELSRHGGILFAYETAFRITKESVWSNRDFNEANAVAKIKILDKAMEDVRRILTDR